MSKGIKKIGILGFEFHDRQNPEQYIVIFKSRTRDYYHVIIDDCLQQNEYYHLTEKQLMEKFKIVI